MKKNLVLFAFLLSTVVYSQKIKIIEGDFSLLKETRNFNVIFDYTKLEIINYATEEDFIKEKSELREKHEKGTGDEFRKTWFNNREAIYKPDFIEYFEKYSGNKEKIKLHENNKDCKFTIKVSSEKMYSGYNVGIWNEEPKLYATITVFESSNQKNIILKTKQILTKGVSRYDSWSRIASCYGKLGKSFGIYMSRKM